MRVRIKIQQCCYAEKNLISDLHLAHLVLFPHWLLKTRAKKEGKEQNRPTGQHHQGTEVAITFHATREASPVGKDHQRQPLPVEVVDGLGCLIGRIREPHLTSLLDYLWE